MTCHYFVDEAGDGTIFGRRGKVIIGTNGCSRFFMLGMLDVVDPSSLQFSLDRLRAQLLTAPYFSVQTCAGQGYVQYNCAQGWKYLANAISTAQMISCTRVHETGGGHTLTQERGLDWESLVGRVVE